MKSLFHFITETKETYIVIYNGTENFPADEDRECKSKDDITRFMKDMWKSYKKESGKEIEYDNFEDFADECFSVQTVK